MKWLTKLFGGKSAPESSLHPAAAQKIDERALALITRQRLLPFSKGFKGADELYVSVNQFLTSLEMRAAGSALLGLTTSPQTARTAAKFSMQACVVKGEMPFFFRDSGNKSVFMDDIYVCARDVADHATKLVGLGQVALAHVYAEALEDRIEDMMSYRAMGYNKGYTYCNGKDVGAYFEIGADEDDDHPIQLVLRRKYRAPQP